MSSNPPHQSRGILIANRSEIALRLQRTYHLFPLDEVHPFGFKTFSVHTKSEAQSLHVLESDKALLLPKDGPSAYLDSESLVSLAKQNGCWAVAPGYGFLSEDASFARLVEDRGLVFLGPTPDQLETLGDKIKARSLASKLGIPTLPGTRHSDLPSSEEGEDLERVLSFVREVIHSNQARGGGQVKIMLKAASGGGGRGIRLVRIHPDFEEQELVKAFRECSREARAYFGDSRVYAELYLEKAKHVEVQILGDGQGGVCHFFERECSLQRRNQKLVEIAPCPGLDPELRRSLISAAIRMAKEVRYRSLGTFEFLVDPSERGAFYFMEVNPRIQVEHTVTEQVTGHDLVALQLKVALGSSLEDLGLSLPLLFPRQTSIQFRINAETFSADGSALPQSGRISTFNVPSGLNLRLDTACHSPIPGSVGQYRVDPLFDSLLAKLIVTAPCFASALALAKRSLDQTVIRGCKTNKSFHQALVKRLQEGRGSASDIYTSTVMEEFTSLYQHSKEFEKIQEEDEEKEDENGQRDLAEAETERREAPEGTKAIELPISGIILSIKVSNGDRVTRGQEVAIVEAMKMEHVVRAEEEGTVQSLLVKEGETALADQPILFYQPLDPDHVDRGSEEGGQGGSLSSMTEFDLNEIRPELAEVEERKSHLTDRMRAEAVAKRHGLGYLTARENLVQLVDGGSFIEYGDLVMAAQRARYDEEKLKRETSGDGILTGWATIESQPVAVVLGDYLVLAGTQGHFHHLKLDRIFRSVLDNPAPLVFYAEGGGGRPGDTDIPTVVAGLNTPSFALLGTIRAKGIPTIGVANGYVFAGNAALLGCCDLVIGTRGGEEVRVQKKRGKTSIGMGGPPMIEGGGLGRFHADQVGPSSIHAENGGIDILVPSEKEATLTARRLVSMFHQTSQKDWKYTSNPILLRHAVPRSSERKRVYDVRSILLNLVDDQSFLELGRDWGKSLVTGFARIEGKAVGILASNPDSPLGGAIDVQSALKASRLIKLLTRTRSMHLVSLCDTPGFMVGPEFEKSAQAGGSFRIFGEWFAESMDFQRSGGRIFAIALRNAYGLGAQAMMGGSTQENFFSTSWPSASFGAMGLEGAVRLSMRKELASIKDPEQRNQAEKRMIQALYKRGEAINMATFAEIDTVIDPASTRSWIVQGMKMVGERIPSFKLMGSRHSTKL
ncbi:ClpP/crotonase [Violaceomyces palustris]|uniref:ClpP/crotonase n=1 Tax=Violaceomyces palustris TaxID=1673888 RepID=A0ACD0NM16_9BASI|nr:ClpP/crotonase [Violaceomyces palustris]